MRSLTGHQRHLLYLLLGIGGRNAGMHWFGNGIHWLALQNKMVLEETVQI